MKLKKIGTILMLSCSFFVTTLTGCDSVNNNNGQDDNQDDDQIGTDVELTFTNETYKNYYSTVDYSNTSGDTLRSSLCTLINTGKSKLSYSGLWTAYQTTDLDADGKIFCVYTGLSFVYGKGTGGQQDQGSGGTAEGQFYNREHTSPQSWYGAKSGSGATGEATDIFNVLPTDKYFNGKRGNIPYGEVRSASFTSSNSSKVGSSKRTDYTSTVFEIADEFKGDIARSYFYMATCYMKDTASFATGEGTENMYQVSGSYVNMKQYTIDLMMKWAYNDPVSAREIARNTACQTVQNNRNPFIDCPNLAYKIWTPSSNYLSL